MTNTPEPPLNGTFLQLLEEHGTRGESEWNQLFSDLKSIGIHRLILQWTVADDAAFYPSTEFRNVKGAPLDRILRLADATDMQVLVGLVHDSGYWSHIKESPEQVANYLKGRRAKSLAAASELLSLLHRHPSVRGWYIPEEVDDISWRSREARAVLLDHVNSLAQELKRRTPNWKVAISAFSQAQSSPQGFEQFWDEFLKRVSVDSIFYQDGIGVGKLDLNGLPVYLQAIRDAATKNGRCLTVVVELFQQTSGPPINDGAFSAAPAPLQRIACQVEIASKYSLDGLVGFSVPEYMTPAAGDAAGKLFSDYRRLLTAGRSMPACDQK